MFEELLEFESGSVYGARLKLRRSTTGNRTYNFDYDAQGVIGSNIASKFGTHGLKFVANVQLNNALSTGSIPIPQDPKENDDLETFTMYSRPTALDRQFGVAQRVLLLKIVGLLIPLLAITGPSHHLIIMVNHGLI